MLTFSSQLLILTFFPFSLSDWGRVLSKCHGVKLQNILNGRKLKAPIISTFVKHVLILKLRQISLENWGRIACYQNFERKIYLKSTWQKRGQNKKIESKPMKKEPIIITTSGNWTSSAEFDSSIMLYYLS